MNVNEAGTITAGAARSHMTLASASERIREMEISLNAPLLVRGRTGVQLTPAGRTLVHHAKLVIDQMDFLYDELGQYGDGLKAHVRMLCNTVALSEYLPELLNSFLVQHPGISVDLQERTSQEIANSLRSGLCDIGVVADSIDLSGLETFNFRPDPLALIVSKDHKLASRTTICFSELTDLPFIGLVEGGALDQHVALQARTLGRRLSYRVRLRSFEAICRMVGAGVGVGIVPNSVASRCARAAKISRVQLTDAWATRNLVLCVRRLDELPSYVQLIAQHCLPQDRARTSGPDSRIS